LDIHIATLDGRTISLAGRIERLISQPVTGIARNSNDRYAHSLGLRITRTCGSDVLLGVLNALSGAMSSEHHAALATLWTKIAADVWAEAEQEYVPAADPSVEFDEIHGEGAWKRCEAAATAAIEDRQTLSRAGLMPHHFTRYGIRRAMADDYLVMLHGGDPAPAQQPKRGGARNRRAG